MLPGQRAYLCASIMSGRYILGTNADCSAAASHANMHRSRQYTRTVTATTANNFGRRMSLEMLTTPAHSGQSLACRAQLQLTGWLCGRQQVQGHPSSGCLQHHSHISIMLIHGCVMTHAQSNVSGQDVSLETAQGF